MTEDTTPPSRIDGKTLVPIGIAITCITAGLSGVVWLATSMQSIQYQLDGLQRSMATLQQNSDSRVSHQTMVNWVSLLSEMNHDKLRVPDFR